MNLSETNLRKFNQLQDVCIERYVNREQKILTTLNFCITALEKLEGWAVFAIFPSDEQDGEKYLLFVEERFSCISAQLNNFKSVVSAKSDGLKTKPQKQSETKNSANGRETGKDGDEEMLVPSIPLKEKVSEISQRYLRDGYHLRSIVIDKLQQNRQHLNTLFQWCFATLRDLELILDEAMIDELYFLVKSKASRILSTIQIYEEAAEEIKTNMSETNQTSQSRSRSSTDHSKTCANGANSAKKESKNSLKELDLTKSFPANALSLLKRLPKLKDRNGSAALDKTNDSTSFHSSSCSSTYSNSETLNMSPDDTGSKFPSSGSTPEPPFSPRPENLIYHPKINKDQLLKNSLKSGSYTQINDL